MHNQHQTPFGRYLRRVQRALGPVDPELWRAIERELRGHLADAAAELERSPDDPQLQRLVIARLGSSRSLGWSLAQAHQIETTSYVTLGFLCAWVLTSMGGFMLGSWLGSILAERSLPMSSIAVFLAHFLGGGTLAALGQSLLAWWLLARDQPLVGFVLRFLAGWLLVVLLVVAIPAHPFWEPVAETLLLQLLLAGGALIGGAHWLALRGRIAAAPLWVALPGTACLAALTTGVWLDGVLRRFVLPASLTQELATFAGVGLVYGLLTGLALVALRVRPTGPLALPAGGASPLPNANTRLVPTPTGDRVALGLIAAPTLLALMLNAGLHVSLPVVSKATTVEISASGVSTQPLESGRTQIVLPSYPATLYVHEDHGSAFNVYRLRGLDDQQVTAVTIYRRDADRLNQAGRIRVLQVRVGDQMLLGLGHTAPGRNLAEPVLLGSYLALGTVLAACFVGALRRPTAART